MLQKLDSLPEEVLGFRVNGPLAIDALGRTAVKGNNAVILLEVPLPEGHDFWDVWRSIRYALAHFRQNYGHIERIAVVSDIDGMHRVSSMDYPLLHGVPEKLFFARARSQALQWASSRASTVA